MLPQLFQMRITHCCCSPRDLVGKMNDRFIFFVEESAAMVEGKGVNLFVGNANPLRRSGVGLGSIFAAVDDRGLEVS